PVYRVNALHDHKNGKHNMALSEGLRSHGEDKNVVLKFPVHFGCGREQIKSGAMAVFISAGRGARDVFRDGSSYRPDKRLNGAEDEDGSFLIPSGIAKGLASVFWRMRLECPGRISAQLRRDSERTEERL